MRREVCFDAARGDQSVRSRFSTWYGVMRIYAQCTAYSMVQALHAMGQQFVLRWSLLYRMHVFDFGYSNNFIYSGIDTEVVKPWDSPPQNLVSFSPQRKFNFNI